MLLVGTVYLIHLDRPYKHARHYLGFAEVLEERLAQHGTLAGARLLYVVRQAGIGWTTVRTWEGASRSFERKLKKRKNAPRLCPLCSPGADTRTALLAAA